MAHKPMMHITPQKSYHQAASWGSGVIYFIYGFTFCVQDSPDTSEKLGEFIRYGCLPQIRDIIGDR